MSRRIEPCDRLTAAVEQCECAGGGLLGDQCDLHLAQIRLILQLFGSYFYLKAVLQKADLVLCSRISLHERLDSALSGRHNELTGLYEIACSGLLELVHSTGAVVSLSFDHIFHSLFSVKKFLEFECILSVELIVRTVIAAALAEAPAVPHALFKGCFYGCILRLEIVPEQKRHLYGVIVVFRPQIVPAELRWWIDAPS